MQYKPLRDEVERLIDHLSDARRKPSPALVKRTADHLSGMLLESAPLLQTLVHPDDLELRARALKHLLELEQIIGRKCSREIHSDDTEGRDH